MHNKKKRAAAAQKQFDELVQRHCSERTTTWFSTAFLGHDLVASIVEFVPLKSRPLVARLCREMCTAPIKELLPRLRVRTVEGSFPHVLAASSGKEDCWYVAKHSVVHAYIDLVVEGSRPCSYVQTERPPKRVCASYVRNVKLRSVADDPHPTGSRERLAHEEFFSSAIECSVELVTPCGERVLSDDGDPALRLTLESACSGKLTSTFTANQSNPLPARVSFNINKLSHGTNREGALFCLKVTGVAGVPTGGTQTLHAMSKPFVIVGHKRTAEAAAAQKKRKR